MNAQKIDKRIVKYRVVKSGDRSGGDAVPRHTAGVACCSVSSA